MRNLPSTDYLIAIVIAIIIIIIIIIIMNFV